ncbi:LolA family protein [Leekyejoonella antrihumi]|uniref:DUF2092 domain-containing protein n=1 Tax=Leekyejoonella antrihumi TaxID=1660198 RepID=A0A563DYT3_9MICO|nr:hypothetical protein [Leekyejoonella antrihumi]TWP35289.1 hypothetical protein FGL98_14300 [Leekyejoonella antrihumi]
MNTMTARHPLLRWSVPGVAVVALIAGGQVATHLPASAAPKLPARTAQQLLTDLAAASPAGFSGIVDESTNLGLPQLPSQLAGGSTAASPLSLLSGTNTLRVWYAAPHSSRIAIMGSASETDAITNGTDAWLWQSAGKTVQHLRLAPDPHRMTTDHLKPTPNPLPGGAAAMTPQGLATWALGMLAPTTRVTTTSDVRVAGRSAYQLTFAPKTSATRIGSVRVAIDAAKHVPLRVQVFARGAGKPAISAGFTSVDFSVPAASRFAFTPPPGSKVTQVTPPAGPPKAHPMMPGSKAAPGHPAAPRPATAGSAWRTVGAGWSSVLVGTLPKSVGDTNAGPSGSGQTGELAGMLQLLPRVSGAWGSGHLLTSALFSAVLTNDGRIAVGAVAPNQLYAALGRG